MSDPSDILDAYFMAQDEEMPEPSFWSFSQFLSPKIKNALTRYERKVGRLLKLDEGLTLMSELTQPDPQKALPRFGKCETCGDWVDRGRLRERHRMDYRECDFCSVPF